MNLYAYCGNNPVNWIDPWGLCSKEEDYIDAKEFLQKGRDNFFNIFRLAWPFDGGWDFSYTDKYAGEKFILPDGTVMTGSEFANYMAGYLGQFYLGDFGYGMARLLGDLYEIRKTGNDDWLDDPESVRDIKHGSEDGKGFPVENGGIPPFDPWAGRGIGMPF